MLQVKTEKHAASGQLFGVWMQVMEMCSGAAARVTD